MRASVDFASKPVAYDIENNGKFQTIVTIECRGLELVDFAPREGWKAKGAESGTVFEDVDLTDGDWADYDEKVCEGSCKTTERYLHIPFLELSH